MSEAGITPNKFIGSQIQIQLKNSRILNGILTVIDPFGNILLSEVWETSRDLLDQSAHVRELGLVSVPKDSVSKVLMSKNNYRKLGLGA